ncbi:Gfo/Idh/MocA family oxidoreductase [Micromonospora sp. DR5-3]|uniref:Gfo/Idh/MocA family protein n=1 Tax=unclassified Micromonospora TaxID=2617518 RepID=UPI0011D361EE|nr:MULTISPECIES: Gfo/Idh/MocA family oxidoreductase [unclassified Micromonospora]MCW3816015.1 Gfo/Idh/MocA family oxidoreductase [Micromonospora sp. DR5-3]TYC20345.1 Gfo/Idh/MocA family oxidoreductase [Micromonospora sp. MP36]
MHDIRLGVVGLGVRGDLAELAHRPGMGSRVVACCDRDPTALSRARDRFGSDLITASDHRELLHTDLDGVLVLTPDHTHEPIGLDFLRAGIPVFMEKPLAITTEGCDRLLAAAHTHGTRLYVGHNMRHMPVVVAMRELIVKGLIGQVKAVWCRHFVGHGGDFYFKDWHADRRNTTSLLLQKGAHDIDVIHWLSQGYTRRVNAMGGLVVYGDITSRRERAGERMTDWISPDNWPPLSQRDLNPVIDVEDLSMVHMQLDNGVFASYQQCHFTPDYWRNYTVIGTEGRLENFGDAEGAVIKVWNRRSDYRADADFTVPVRTPEGSHGGADPRLIQEFVQFIRAGGATITSPVAAREAVAAGHAATISLREGSRVVDVPPVDPAVAAYFDNGQTEGTMPPPPAQAVASGREPAQPGGNSSTTAR